MAKAKFYVVWVGKTPGVYDNWADCEAQVKSFVGAKYKSFPTRAEAEAAFQGEPTDYFNRQAKPSAVKGLQNPPSWRSDTVLPLHADVIAEAWAVDAACSGNPGQMEYRGVDLRTGQELFRIGPMLGTNNIGEFLAIVHALALQAKQGICLPIYSDSRNALAWIKGRHCKTKLSRSAASACAFALIDRAEAWLATHHFTNPLYKWETSQWGEIPADFGRK